MGRLITVSLILILGAWGGAAAAAAPTTRPLRNLGDPPAAARAPDQVFGSWGALFNRARWTVTQLDLATKYLQAAELIAISFSQTSRQRSMPT